MEHLHHFGLADDPFRNEPRLELFLETGPHQDALRRLERAVRQRKALSLLLGESGAGKTMIVRQLHERLEEEAFESIVLVVLKGEADASWMLRRFAAQLGVEEPSGEGESVLAKVYEHLAIIREDGRHAVLLIDDAHGLAGRATLREMCGLLKLEYEDRPLLSMVLAGIPALEAALASDPVLARRADVKVRIAPLDEQGTSLYLTRRIQGVGGTPAILDPSAVKALYQFGGGFPGLINTLADNALFEAFLCGRNQVTGTDVERVYNDLAWGAAPPAAPAVGAAGRAPRAVTGRASVLEGGAAFSTPDGPDVDADLVVDLLDD